MKYKTEKCYRFNLNYFLLYFWRKKFSNFKIIKLQETVRKAIKPGNKLIHCNDVRTMFAYFQIIHLKILKWLILSASTLQWVSLALKL